MTNHIEPVKNADTDAHPSILRNRAGCLGMIPLLIGWLLAPLAFLTSGALADLPPGVPYPPTANFPCGIPLLLAAPGTLGWLVWLSGRARRGVASWLLAAAMWVGLLAAVTFWYWLGSTWATSDRRPVQTLNVKLVPRPLAVDQTGMVYVSDPENRRIHRLSPNLGHLGSWRTEDVSGREYNVDAMAAAPNGDVYIADAVNNRVLRVKPGGIIVREWGGRDSEPKQFKFFYFRAGIAADAAGAVYVSDSWNHRVLRLWPPDWPDAQWQILASGPGPRLMTFPQALVVGADGMIYVAEPQHDRIRKLGPRGEELALWARSELHPSQVREPEGLALDNVGNLYVADTGNMRLLKLSPDGVALAEWDTGALAAVVVHPWGNIYTSAKGVLRVEQRGSDGTIRSTWDGPPPGAGVQPGPR